MTEFHKALESLPREVVDEIGQEMSCLLVPRPQDFEFKIVLERKVFERLLRKVAQNVLSSEEVGTILARGDEEVFMQF